MARNTFTGSVATNTDGTNLERNTKRCTNTEARWLMSSQLRIAIEQCGTNTILRSKTFDGGVVATDSDGISKQEQRYTFVSPDGKDTYTGSVATNTDSTNTR